ncbi:MAG: type II secretion system F family protein [Azospirillaceae bacterium]
MIGDIPHEILVIAAIVVVGLGLTLLVGALSGRRAKRVEERLAAVTQGRVPQTLAKIEEDEGGLKLPAFLQSRLARAGYAPEPIKVYIALFVILLPGFPVGVFAGTPMGVLVGLMLPAVAWLVLQRMADRRMKAFGAALPGFIDRLRQLVVIGKNLQQATIMAVETSPADVRRIMQPMLWRLRHGASISEAVRWLAYRMDIPETNLLAAAIATNQRFGGPIAKVLDGLVHTLRAKEQVERELRSATSEARATAWVLGLLPPLVATFVFVVNPMYVRFFIEDPTGRQCFYVGIAMQCAGALALFRSLKVDY